MLPSACGRQELNSDENWILNENLSSSLQWRLDSIYLIGGAAVIVPDRKVLDAAGRLVQGLGLAPETLPRPVNPDVESLHSEHRSTFREISLTVKMSFYLSPWSSVKYFCRIDLSDEVIVVQRLMKTKVKTPKPSVAATTSEM